jgi:DNA-binding transcriptional ArsR family regulator
VVEEEKRISAGDDTCEAFCFNEEMVESLREALPEEAQVRRAEQFFSALGNRTRLLVLFCLARAEELCVCDIANALEMNLSTVSHQLRHLRSLGLVDYRREGKMAFYRLAQPRVGDLLASEFEQPKEDGT